MYATDRGIEELEARRGEEEVSLGWLAEQLRTFVDLNPEFEVPVERLATWLARLDASSLGATLREVVVFLYCVAVPALLLIAGVLGRDDLGVPDGQTLADWLR